MNLKQKQDLFIQFHHDNLREALNCVNSLDDLKDFIKSANVLVEQSNDEAFIAQVIEEDEE